MKQLTSRAEPRFRWTGLLILVPVFALGAVGLWQLRQDRAAALAEARADVEDELEQVLKIGRSIPNFDDGADFPTAIFSADGEISWPEQIPLVPKPSAASNLHAEKLDLILSDPGLNPSEQAHALRELALIENSGTTAAGFPVKQLALRNALRFGRVAKIDAATLREWAFELTDDVIKHPTILSEKLLLEAKTFHTDSSTRWNQELAKWDRAQFSRKFLQEHSSSIQGLLSELANQDDEATLSKWTGTAPEILCILRKGSKETFLYALTAERVRQGTGDRFEAISLPRHLAIRLSLGERLVFGNPEAEVLSMSNDPKSKIRAEIVFTDRDSFFQPVKQRSIRTAWFIGFAVLAAGAGWFVAWRAFVTNGSSPR